MDQTDPQIGVHTPSKVNYRRRFFDEYGNEYYGIDIEMRDRIKIKLITNIIHNFDLIKLPDSEMLEE